MELESLFAKSKTITVKTDSNNNKLITVSRKSRFIKKDAELLLAKIASINSDPSKISLEINAPLCSKAKRILETSEINFLS